MKSLTGALLFLSLSAAALAAPSRTSLEIPRGVAEKRAVCTPASLGNTQEDDTPAIAAAISSCGNGGTIVIPAGTTYSLRTMLQFTGCVGCDFQLEGTLKASDDTTYWATQPAIIYLNNISGAKIRSLTGSGVIDGNGQDAYDLFASDSSLVRPTLVYTVGTSSNIAFSGLKVKNPPNVFFSQKGTITNMAYSSLTMTAASKSTNAPKNTDGFDIGQSTYTTITDVTVSNQDDCVAFKSGSNYVTVTGITCTGMICLSFHPFIYHGSLLHFQGAMVSR
jgi:galacturan 1,4-alpha-galacturonidase